MTRKEQIIEILGKYSIVKVWYDEGVSIVSAPQKEAREELADALVALPLDVPSDDEIEAEYPLEDISDFTASDFRYKKERNNLKYQFYGVAKWMRGEIIKRNS